MELKNILITGIAGFIGSRLAEHITSNFQDCKIVGVDNLHSGKFKNLSKIKLADYYNKLNIDKCLKLYKFDIIFHQGACSDTTENDENYLNDNNYLYSKKLLDYSNQNECRLVYASSAAIYGLNSDFEEIELNESPLNLYGISKLNFDNYVRKILNKKSLSVVGLRYFNVYGPNEYHKGKMSSVIFHFYHQYTKFKHVKVFGKYGGYDDGMHSRDFIYIDDVIDIIMKFAFNNINGIFNLGTGESVTYNEIARCVISSVENIDLSLDYCISNDLIKYIPFPDELSKKYQCFTKADLKNLKKSGVKYVPSSYRSNIKKYINKLKKIHGMGNSF